MKKMILEMKEIYKNIITPFFLSTELVNGMINFKNKIPDGITETSAALCKMISKGTKYYYQPIFNPGVNESNLNKYFYFDQFHPGMWFHQQIANSIINLIENFQAKS